MLHQNAMARKKEECWQMEGGYCEVIMKNERSFFNLLLLIDYYLINLIW